MLYGLSVGTNFDDLNDLEQL